MGVRLLLVLGLFIGGGRSVQAQMPGGDPCPQLATQLATYQSQLEGIQDTLNTINVEVGLLYTTLVIEDGGVFPLNSSAIMARIMELMMATPPQYAVVADYTALLGLLMTAQMAAGMLELTQLQIDQVIAQQADAGC